MKLFHVAGFVAAVGVAFGCGCATSQPQAPVASSATVTSAEVSTTHLDAAEAAAERKAAPKVGKLQRTEAASLAADDEGSDEPKAEPRRDDRRRGGGFSGWK